MNKQTFLNVFPVSSGSRWVGELDINSTVQYRYHYSLEDDGFLNSAEETVETGFVHADQLGVDSTTIVVQVFASYDEYAGLEIFV